MQDAKREIFGRINANGDVAIFMVADGEAVTKLDANVYPVGSYLSARHEHPQGIILTLADAAKIGMKIEF